MNDSDGRCEQLGGLDVNGSGVNALRGAIRRCPGQPEVRQSAVIHLLLTQALGRQHRIAAREVTVASPSPQRAHGNGAQADPEYAAQEPQTGCGGTVAPAAKARLYPSRLLAIPGVAPSRHAPGGEGKEKVRRQTIPADDASWRAYCVIVSWFRSQSLSSRYSCLC